MANFVFTNEFDNFTGSEATDTFTGTAANIQAGDSVNGGGGGNDQLHLTGGGNFDLSGVTLTGILKILSDGSTATIRLPGGYSGSVAWTAATVTIIGNNNSNTYAPEVTTTNVTLTAGAGSDTFNVISGANLTGSSLDGGDGTDTLAVADANFVLTTLASFTNFERITLTTGGGNKTLTGTPALLNGLTIIGGAGIDTIATTDSLALGNLTLINVERIVTTSTTGVTLTGDAGTHTIVGSPGADTIMGGGGADTLTGNGSFDIFRGTSAQMRGVTITDFGAGDRIELTDLALANASVTVEGSTISVLNNGANAVNIILTGSTATSFALTSNGSTGVFVMLGNTPSTPDLAAASDTGVSSTDNITNAAALSFSGTTGATSGTVTVFIDKDNSGTLNTGDTSATVAIANNAWTVSNLSTAGLEGAYNVYAFATVDSVNTALSGALNVTLDRTAPTTTVGNTITLSADTGASATDFITATAAQSITGTLSAGLVAGETLQVSLDNGATWNAGTADGTNWRYGGTLTASNTLKVRVTDAAGNTSAEVSKAYVLDTAGPVFQSGQVSGSSIVLTYTDASQLDATNLPANGTFRVQVGTGGGEPLNPTAVTVNATAKTVTLTMATAIAAGTAVTVSYTDPSGGNDAAAVQDLAGNDAASFAATAVSNPVPAPPAAPAPPAPPPAPPTPAPRGVDISEFSTVQAGTTAADNLQGGAARDLFYASGNDTFDGGDGVDTVILSGNRSDYTITRGADGLITLAGPGNTTITLTNIERLQFGDKVYAMNTTRDTPALAAAYSMLGRNPESDGFEYWSQKQADGDDVYTLARKIVNSDEFQNLYGARKADAYIENLYENFLGRRPTAREMNFYLDMADDIVPGTRDNPAVNARAQARLLTAFLESKQVEAKFIGVVDNGIELSV